jgi:hypothetical protein
MMENSDRPSDKAKPEPLSDDPTVVILSPAHPSAAKMGQLFTENKKGPVQTLDSTEVLEKRIKEGLHCVVIISVAKDSNLANSLTFMNGIRVFTKRGSVRIIVISKVYNENLRNAMTARGANEFLNDKTSPSTLFFKTTLFFGQLQRMVGKLNGDDSSKKVTGSRKDSSKQENIMVKGGASQVTLVEAIAEDIWLIKGTPPKKIGVQWVVEAEGPDPDSGSWEFVGQSDSHQEQWAWKPRSADGKELAKNPNDAWNFAGNRPVFDPESKKWRFVGTKPDLSYQKKGVTVGSKVRLDAELGMVVAADNSAAEEKIKESRRVGEIVKAQRDKETQAKIEATRAKEIAESGQNLQSSAKAQEEEDDAALKAALQEESDDIALAKGGASKDKDGSHSRRKEGKSASDKNGAEPDGPSQYSDEEDDEESANRFGQPLTAEERQRMRAGGKNKKEDLENSRELGLALNDDEETEEGSSGKGKIGRERKDQAELSRRGGPDQEKDKIAARARGEISDDEDENHGRVGFTKDKEGKGNSRSRSAVDKNGKPIPGGRSGNPAEGHDEENDESLGPIAREKRAALAKEGKSGPSKEALDKSQGLGRPGRSGQERDENGKLKSQKEAAAPNPNSLQGKIAAAHAAAAEEAALKAATAAAIKESANSSGGKLQPQPGEKGVELSDWEAEKKRGRAGLKLGADEEASEIIQKNYVFRRTNGKLRAKKGEMALERVASIEFGNEEGVWEKVGEVGWIFMTPELKSKGLDSIKDLEPYWYLDKEPGALAPFYDEATKTWLFNNEQTVSKSGSFENLPADYQSHLLKGAEKPKTLTAARGENEALLKEANDLTAKTFEAFADIETDAVATPELSAEAGVPEKLTSKSSEKSKNDKTKDKAAEAAKTKGPSHLGFFLKLSDMLNSGKPREEIYKWMTGYVVENIKVDHVFILKYVVPGMLDTNVLASTNPNMKVGQNYDLAKTLFRDAPDLKDKKLIQLSEVKQVALHPIIRVAPTELNIGVMIVQASSDGIQTMNANDHFFIQLRKQLGRLLASPGSSSNSSSGTPAKSA